MAASTEAFPNMPEPKSLQAPNQALQPAWCGYDAEPTEPPAVPLAHYLWILRRHRWKILTFVFACVAAVVIISARLTPIYESTATVDIDRQMPTGIIGQDSTRVPMNDSDQFLATQVKLIQSDSVLRPVARQFHLLYFAKDASGAPPSKSVEAAEDTPVLLKRLKVTRPPNTYLLLISYRSPDRRLASGVANGVARSYVEHTYDLRYQSSASLSSFMERQLEELKAKMERSSAAVAGFERDLNVINPEQKTSILSARLLQINTEYTNAQTDRVRKESAWNSVRSGSMEAAEVSTQGESLKTLTAKLDEENQKFAEVKTHYGPNHPEYRKAAVQVEELERQLQQSRRNAAGRVEVEYGEALSRESMLKKAVAETKAEFDRLNASSFEYQSLKRGADADKSLYEELIRRIKEAGINAGFQNSAIRIADPARPGLQPVFPNLKLNILLAFLFSSLLAVGVAILSDVLDSSVRSPEQIANQVQIEVLGSLPLVKPWRRRLVSALENEGGGTALLPAGEGVTPRNERHVTGFEEAIRTLRNSILLGSLNHSLKSLMVTSASPLEGKTTTAVHLALAHALQKHKTLLIDGDLRCPGVHAKFGIHPESGLAGVLQNGLLWRAKLIKLEAVPYLDILAGGYSSRQAADLIGGSLPLILKEAAREYDLIIIDSPPILGFPEPLQMAAAVDGVLVIARAGQTNRKAVGSALTTLQRVRANVVGLVINEVTSDASDTSRYGGYDGRRYQHYRSNGA
jgi:capsular exopolysaccharide synthesis family protein